MTLFLRLMIFILCKICLFMTFLFFAFWDHFEPFGALSRYFFGSGCGLKSFLGFTNVNFLFWKFCFLDFVFCFFSVIFSLFGLYRANFAGLPLWSEFSGKVLSQTFSSKVVWKKSDFFCKSLNLEYFKHQSVLNST